MTSPITFRQATATANAMLSADRKAKPDWSKLPIADLPGDLQALAIAALEAEIAAKSAKFALQEALDDKVEAPSGKRLIVTLGRDVSMSTDSILFAWVAASAGSTRTVSFAQFTKG